MDFDADFDPVDEVLTVTNDGVVLRLHAAASELLGLGAALDADWSARGSLAVGTTSLGRVFWCAGTAPGTVNVLVGPDDETWDLCLVMSGQTVRNILVLAGLSPGSG